jgi:hypothetical protein
MFEHFLIHFDDTPWAQMWRVALGVLLPPIISVLASSNEAIGTYFVLFAAFLITLRLFPAVVRYTVPIGPQVKTAWKHRRFLAKEYDSYQWQKLFWFGLGMSFHLIAGRTLGKAGVMLMAFCLIGGGLGLVVWLMYGRSTPRMPAVVPLSVHG